MYVRIFLKVFLYVLQHTTSSEQKAGRGMICVSAALGEPQPKGEVKLSSRGGFAFLIETYSLIELNCV